MNKYSKSLILNFICEYIKKSKIYIIFILLAIIIPSIILAIYTMKLTTIELSIDSITDLNLLNFLKEDISWITFLFYRLLEFIIALIIIALPIYSVLFIPATLIVLFYKIYNFTINIYILIFYTNVLGLLNTIIIVIPTYLLSALIYYAFVTIILDVSLFHRKNKNNLCCIKRNSIKDVIMVLTIMKICIIIYEIILISIFSNKFIIT